MAENTLTKDEVDDRIETGVAFIVILLMTTLGAYLMQEDDSTIEISSPSQPAPTKLDHDLALPSHTEAEALPVGSSASSQRDRASPPPPRLPVPSAPIVPALAAPVIAEPIAERPAGLAQPAAPVIPALEVEEVKIPSTIEPSVPASDPNRSEIFRRVEGPAAVTESIAEPDLDVPVQAAAPVAAEVSLEESAVLEEATSSVSFVVASAILTEESKAVLDKIAALLSARPDTRLRVTGFTDNQGDNDNNLALSFARAEACREYLLANGVAVGQVDSLGMGERQPIADNATAEGRQLNRRVEFTLLTNP